MTNYINFTLQKIEVNKTSIESYVEYSDYDEEIVQEYYSEDASNNIFLVTKIFNSELFNFVNEMYNNSVVPRKCVQFYDPKIIFFFVRVLYRLFDEKRLNP
jgi:hypothetical protein